MRLNGCKLLLSNSVHMGKAEKSVGLFSFNKAVCLYYLTRYEEALISCEKAREINPNEFRRWGILDTCLNRQGRNEEAMNYFEKALKQGDDSYNVWFGKGLVFADQKRFDEALMCYDKAIEYATNTNVFIDVHTLKWSWISKASLLGDLGRYDEALKSLDKLLEVDPKRAGVWNNKGIILQVWEDIKKPSHVMIEH
jgi:tetratricopeptide (TPR) repeat protein